MHACMLYENTRLSDYEPHCGIIMESIMYLKDTRTKEDYVTVRAHGSFPRPAGVESESGPTLIQLFQINTGMNPHKVERASRIETNIIEN